MLNDVTVFNIREYLSGKDDKVLGEDELRDILSGFSCEKNGFKRFDTKEVKPGTEDAHTLIQLLKVM